MNDTIESSLCPIAFVKARDLGSASSWRPESQYQPREEWTTLNLLINLQRVQCILAYLKLCTNTQTTIVKADQDMDKKQLTLMGKTVASCIFLYSHILLGTKLYFRNDYSRKLPPSHLFIRPQNSEIGFAKL